MNRNVRTYNSVGVAMTSRVARSRPYVLSDIFVITFPYLIRRLTKLSSSYTVFPFSSPSLSSSFSRYVSQYLIHKINIKLREHRYFHRRSWCCHNHVHIRNCRSGSMFSIMLCRPYSKFSRPFHPSIYSSILFLLASGRGLLRYRTADLLAAAGDIRMRSTGTTNRVSYRVDAWTWSELGGISLNIISSQFRCSQLPRVTSKYKVWRPQISLRLYTYISSITSQISYLLIQ